MSSKHLESLYYRGNIHNNITIGQNNMIPSSIPNTREQSKFERKLLLKESIRKALAEGVINDETLAYIRALGYARHHNPDDLRIQEAIRETLRSIQIIYEPESPTSFSPTEQAYNTQRAQEKLGEGLLENFGEHNHEHLAVTVPSRIIRYLEKQRILLIPLHIKTSTIGEAGHYRNFHYRLQGKRDVRQMYALDEHWIGLYFAVDSHMVAKGERDIKKIYNPAHPVTVDNTNFVFVDTNLRGTNIDLFYPGLIYQLNAEKTKGNTSILYLNLTFKNCWVKNMNLQFWRYISNFPGTITITFEDCDDFDEAYFPYLQKEASGKRYYLDLEKFSQRVEDLASDKFLQYLENILHFSSAYEYEHLR